MTPTTLQKNVKIGFLGLIVVAVVLPSIFLTNNPNTLDNNLFNPNPVNDLNEPLLQSSSDFTQLPYLRNSTPYLDWSELMINDVTLPISPLDENMPLYFSKSDRSGENILDDNQYLEDLVVFFDSFAELLGYSNSEILSYYNRLNDFTLWDSDSVEQGYYTYIAADAETNSSIKELQGNSQYILSLDDLLADTTTKSGASALIVSQWDSLLANFEDTDNLLFNHSNVDSQKYMKDQLLLALSGFLIKQYGLPSASAADSIATEIMEILIDEKSGVPNYLIYNNDAFDYKRDTDISSISGSSIRDLETNAYGILALLEWFVSDNLVTNANYNRLAKAEAIFTKFYSNLWNDTYSLFMNTMTQADSNVIDDSIDLEANAVMMLAILRLYQITGDFSYFEILMEMYSGIETYLRDPVYGTYYNSLNSTTSVVDSTKALKSQSYLINTYLEIENFVEQTDITLDLNQTTFIKGEETPLNISVDYYFDFNIFSGGFSVSKNYGVANSTQNYIIRAPNNTIIQTDAITADEDGKSYLIFNFTDGLELGDYQVSLMVNYTGVATEYATASFAIESGFEIVKATSDSSIRCGGELNVSLSLDSSRETNLTLDIVISGEQIENTTYTDQEIVNDLVNNYTYFINVDQFAEFGSSQVEIQLVKGNITYAEQTLNFLIKSSIDVSSVEQDSTVFRGRNFSTIVSVSNLKDFDETIIVELTGDYITLVNTTIEISSLESKTLDLLSFIAQEAPLGDLDYKLEVKRESDGSVINSYTLSSTIKNPIEVISISAPEFSYHWRENNIICTVKNNMDIAQKIVIRLNDEVVSSISNISPGETSLSIPITGNLRNPYDLGDKHFNVQVYDVDGILLYETTVKTTVQPSLGSILLGYVLPLVIPIVGIVVVKHIALENKKRLK